MVAQEDAVSEQAASHDDVCELCGEIFTGLVCPDCGAVSATVFAEMAAAAAASAWSGQTLLWPNVDSLFSEQHVPVTGELVDLTIYARQTLRAIASLAQLEQDIAAVYPQAAERLAHVLDETTLVMTEVIRRPGAGTGAS